MDTFSDILSIFDPQSVYLIKNSLGSQKGYLFRLSTGVSYLFIEERRNGKSILIYEDQQIHLGPSQRNKLLAILRMNQLQPEILRQSYFYTYSMSISRAMEKLIHDHPRLAKGSSHMAFAPLHHTRFSKNLIFDFDYLYDDVAISEIIANFVEIYASEISPINQEFSDDILYGFLLDKQSELRKSINGRISLPEYLLTIFLWSSQQSISHLVIDFGPRVLLLRGTTVSSKIFLSRSVVAQNNEIEIIEPSSSFVEQCIDTISEM